MDVQERFAEREVVFTIAQDDRSLLEKLSFVHLVKMKFDADEKQVGWFKAKGNDPYVQVNLSFSDWSVLSNARSHCSQFLDSSGAVIATYRGALQRADPSSKMAKSLQKYALANRLL